MKNRYLNFLSVLKFAATQDEPKGAKRATQDQFFLTMPTIRQVLINPLLAEEALFSWAFQS